MIQTISELVAQVESGNDIRALRFEPNYVPDEHAVTLIISFSPIFVSHSTARNIASCSWGKFQMMGANIYNLGYHGSIFDFWNEEELQCFYFDKFLEFNNINYTLEQIVNNESLLNKFARVYNGTIDYGKTLIDCYEKNLNF